MPGNYFRETTSMVILQNSIKHSITTLILIKQIPRKYVQYC